MEIADLAKVIRHWFPSAYEDYRKATSLARAERKASDRANAGDIAHMLQSAEVRCERCAERLRELIHAVQLAMPETWRAIPVIDQAAAWRHQDLDWAAINDALRRIEGDAIAGCVPSGDPKAQHSDDFRSVNWFGETYSFTPIQAPCIRVLWEHWERGLEVGGSLLLESAESAGDRPTDIFRRHSAWGTMIVPGKSKGTYTLKTPDG